MNFLKKLFGDYSTKELKRIQPLLKKIGELQPTYEKMSDDDLRAEAAHLKERVTAEGTDAVLPEAFALCSEAAWRVIGQRPFDTQLTGGIILHQGRIAEMKTGEGKTLTAVLPTFLNALTGEGVHIVTVNEYLAQRDAEWMGKIHRFLGLTVGLIRHDMNNDDRRAAYAADITYGTNNEFGFDYLRDNMVVYKKNKVQRGHAFAIVDEVDSILIDEARTPLIISGQGEKSTDLYGRANALARDMRAIRVTETDAKEDNDELYKDYDYVINEKQRSATLTPRGVKKAEAYFNLENLTDPENMTVAHHVNQAIKAHGIMKRDTDYVVRENQVIIVDEFTGRLMYGRRFNDGLHQALEAKEGVKIANESQTMATITFQNYFRLYKKLSGMTGTAMTEEAEFREIYHLDVVEIPTHLPMIRQDCPDVIYKNEPAKFRAVIEDILQHHATGQPVLVGTVTIEKSEVLSKLLRACGVRHEVLNAKHHEKEAEIIAQAGQKGAVTIATNMAGRGTDIMLGGNAEYLAKAEMHRLQFTNEMIEQADAYSETDDEEILNARKTYKELLAKYKDLIKPQAAEVRALGGLYIIGTERHESRRIDNQLRGRAGRQGDPGMSRFYISLEDDLMRLFGGDRLQVIMDRMKVEDDMPLETNLLSSTIENAQKRVEGRNFSIRKNVLQYDDVVNKQREVIYTQRDKVLNGENIRPQITNMLEQNIEENVANFMPADAKPEDWDVQGLRKYFLGWLIGPEDTQFGSEVLVKAKPETVCEALKERAMAIYDNKEKTYGFDMMREIERVVLLRNVDRLWIDHIDAMEDLKQGIYLRSYSQKDPVMEYRTEGSDMFDEMIGLIRERTAKDIMTVHLARTNAEPEREQVAKGTATNAGGDGSAKKEPVRKSAKIGRNDPCPCGSGLKWKKCTCAQYHSGVNN